MAFAETLGLVATTMAVIDHAFGSINKLREVCTDQESKLRGFKKEVEALDAQIRREGRSRIASDRKIELRMEIIKREVQQILEKAAELQQHKDACTTKQINCVKKRMYKFCAATGVGAIAISWGGLYLLHCLR